MSSPKPSIRLFYVNGMMTGESKASEATLAVCSIHKQLHLLNQHEVEQAELHWNDTTSQVGLYTAIASAGLGMIGLTHQLLFAKKRSAPIQIASAVAILGALFYKETREDEREIKAAKLAIEIRDHLDLDPRNRVTLVMHSQGALIGGQVVELLSQDPETRECLARVHTITIGGAKTLAGGGIGCSHNITFMNDWIASVARALLPSRIINAFAAPTDHEGNATEGEGNHAALYYINSNDFKTAMHETFVKHLAALIPS